MKGDFHVRLRENLRVKLPWVTRLAAIGRTIQASKQKGEISMNRFRVTVLLALVATFVLSCSEDKEEMDPWETQTAKQLQADNIQLSHVNTSRTVNGVSAGGESYLQLNIFDSKVLGQIDHNKRLMTNKCDEIKDIVLTLPEIAAFPAFNDLKLNVIETSGVLVFKSQKTNTITYRIH
jgi:hypothetical protein